jgi:signal peptidase complex subunit 3
VTDNNSVRGRPHYYSSKNEEYAIVRFSLDADLSSLFTWNTKQVFVYVTAVWPSNSTATSGADLEAGLGAGENEAVIWDTIITAPSSDHLSNIKAAAKRKLIKSSKGKSIDPSR